MAWRGCAGEAGRTQGAFFSCVHGQALGDARREVNGQQRAQLLQPGAASVHGGAELLWEYGSSDTVARLKTTIEIPDGLAEEAKATAAREKTTLRALVEAGLRQVLRERRRKPRFQLRDASFRGRGLQPAFRDADWQRIREAAYEGHGG